MASKKILIKTKTSLDKIFLTLFIVSFVVVVIVITVKHTLSESRQTFKAPASATLHVSTTGWESYTLPNAKLSFIYPQDWKVDQIPNQSQDYDAVVVWHGKYLIDIIVYKQNSFEAQPGHSMAGSLTDWTPIDSFFLNNQTIYILNEGGNGSNGSEGMTLSSCASNTKCLVKAKNVPGYIDIMSSYKQGSSGDVAPGTIQASDPNLGIIKKIIKSITYK